jgi:S1-C subfamily serine protease
MLIVPALEMRINTETLPNVFAPPAALVSRYAGSVVAIDVITKDGDESRGTGFVVRGPQWHEFQIFTCRHNVDRADGIIVKSVTTQANATIQVGEWNFHPSEDVAVASIRSDISIAPAFWLRPDIEVFDEVYTLGFPKIPHSDAGIIGHRGEVNGFATPYQKGGELMLISNLVSPGNSGGPVLDKSGYCVGMSIRWLEGQWGQEKARFSAALPAKTLVEMLR